MTSASASASTVQTIELPRPPPKMPEPRQPEMAEDQPKPTSALSTMPPMLITSTQPGRSSAETKLRIAWNSTGRHHDHI